MWAEWVSAKASAAPTFQSAFAGDRQPRWVRDPKYWLGRFKPPADGQLGISGRRCSMDIGSSEYLPTTWMLADVVNPSTPSRCGKAAATTPCFGRSPTTDFSRPTSLAWHRPNQLN